MIEYWFMLPVAVVLSTVAMMLGISSAALFTPLFLIVFGLPVPVAIASALLIEIFGLAEGVLGFAKRKLISYPSAKKLLTGAVPAVFIGALFAAFVPSKIVMMALAGFLLVIGFRVMHDKHFVTHKHHSHHNDAEHTTAHFSHKEKMLSTTGGFFSGLSSVGAGEVSDYLLLKRFDGPVAAGTAVYIIALTALAGVLAHGYILFTQHEFFTTTITYIMAFTIPGVIIGSQTGVRLAKKISDDMRHKLLSGLFFAIATTLVLFI